MKLTYISDQINFYIMKDVSYIITSNNSRKLGMLKSFEFIFCLDYGLMN
jgi:hypothetical protein